MSIDERSRHELFLAAEKTLGRQQTETLMELLPPVGWAEVATKQDLSALEDRMSLRFDLVDQRFEMIDQRFEMIDQRFEMMDRRFEMIDPKFDMVDLKFDAQSAHLLGELDRRFAQQTRTLFLSLSGMAISLTTVLLTVLLTVR